LPRSRGRATLPRAAMAAQADLRSEPWPGAVDRRVRMALHAGEAIERDGDYFGPTLNRAARLMAIAPADRFSAPRPRPSFY
jgi:class 3 adenylate cyclase